jgi:rhodanese-related sulfurtransferase
LVKQKSVLDCYSKTLYFYKKTFIMNLSQEDWVSQFESDQNAVILDVRTEGEWNEGIIANAVKLDINKGQAFIYSLEGLDKSKNYYVYCRSGVRSAKACEIMNELGFQNTYNLMGGILEWEGETVEP